MWFTRFGEYINRGWREAALAAFVFSLIPFMGWVGIVIMALVTMRTSPKQGSIILLVTAIPSLVFLWFGVDAPWVIAVLSGNVLAWILAVVLRQTSDWSKVLLTSVLVTVIFIVLLRLFVPDLHGYWFHLLNKLYSQANKDEQILLQIPPTMNLKSYLLAVAKMLTPLLVLIQVILALSNLLIARWWQASLFNPGGLSKELYQVKLSYWCSVILIATIAAIYLGITIAWTILPVVVLIYFLGGVAVFHALVRSRKTKTPFIWLFYGLVVLLAPYSLAIVAGLGIADSFVDFRAKDTRSTKNGEK